MQYCLVRRDKGYIHATVTLNLSFNSCATGKPEGERKAEVRMRGHGLTSLLACLPTLRRRLWPSVLANLPLTPLGL